MKKISVLALGIIIGISLAITSSVFADDIKKEIVSMIGKQVQGSFPLVIGDKRADKDVLVIEGTSYLPVRSAADLFGYEVGFDADLGVKLKKKAVNSMETTSVSSLTDTNLIKIKEFQDQIKINEDLIGKTKDYILHSRDGISDDSIIIDPTIYNDRIKELENKNATLQTQITELSK